jgi:hypothetical protein
MKEYLKNSNGKIKNCASNIAKMNIFEYVLFDINCNNVIKHSLKETLEQYIEGFISLFWAVINTTLIVCFPITLLTKAILTIKHSKKQVEEFKRGGESI